MIEVILLMILYFTPGTYQKNWLDWEDSCDLQDALQHRTIPQVQRNFRHNPFLSSYYSHHEYPDETRIS